MIFFFSVVLQSSVIYQRWTSTTKTVFFFFLKKGMDVKASGRGREEISNQIWEGFLNSGVRQKGKGGKWWYKSLLTSPMSYTSL